MKLLLSNFYFYCSQLINNIVNSWYWRLGRFKLYVNGISYGQNLIVQGNLYINIGKFTYVTIGDSCCFKSGLGSNPLSRNIKGSLCVENGASLIIGNNCGFSSVCLWSHHSITIGNNVNIGADTILLDSDAHSLLYIERRNERLDIEKKVSKPIIIDDDVLIGTRCIILKGVHIGARSIIGSGSIVVSNIPSDCIAAGNPAKIIKRLN